LFKKLNRCFIIAEIGGNFTTYEQAVALTDAAQIAGVDCIKLQTFTADTIVSSKAFFDMESTGKISQREYFKQYEISQELHKKIISYFEERNIAWFSTPSHKTDLDMLLELGMKAIKIGADDANNLPFLRDAARSGLPIVLSTGMCTLEEVKESVNVIVGEGNPNVVILHTVSGYPTYPEDVNLNILATYQREFPGFYIGFSDHTLSPLAIITAAALGADVVERHFTLDKEAEGPDHRISADPKEMKYIVKCIRTFEKMRGSGIKMPFGPEVVNRINNRKSLHAIKAITKGDIFTSENVGILRPGFGIEPKFYDSVIGKKATRDIKTDEILSWGDFN
jgi:N-acetylneuraminate synthase